MATQIISLKKSTLLSLGLHLGLIPLLIYLATLIPKSQLVGLQNKGKMTFIQAELTLSAPQASSSTPPPPLEASKTGVSNLADKVQLRNHAGNTKMQANSSNESRLKAGRLNTDLQTKSPKQKPKQAPKQSEKHPSKTDSKSDSKPSSAVTSEKASQDTIQTYSPFLRRINDALVTHWTRPENVRQGENLSTSFTVHLNPNGSILKVELVQSSGNTLFDRSALAAIRKIGAFAVPKDSKAFKQYFQKLHIDFTNPS